MKSILKEKKIKYNSSIKNLFKSLKIKKNDNLLIHSNVFPILKNFGLNNSYKLEKFIEIAKKVIGNNGNILIPAYNYDFFKGKIFDPKNSPSQVGYFSNFLLKKNKYSVTRNPVFRHIVIGRIYKKIKKLDDFELFGKNSVFELILKKNFKIMCFCCSPNNMTFIHYIEKKLNVKYRYEKEIDGKLFLNKKIKKKRIKYFFGKKKINYSIKHKNIIKITKDKNFIIQKFFGFSCYIVSASNLFQAICNRIKKKENFLVEKR